MNYLDIVLSLLLAVLTGFIIPLITRKLGADRTAEIEKWTGIFVQATEQLYKDAKGTDKKELVMRKLISMFNADVDELSDMVESEVLKMNLQKK